MVSVGKVKLRTSLSRNFNLRTSEAHFIKKSARRGTTATCDSLVLYVGGYDERRDVWCCMLAGTMSRGMFGVVLLSGSMSGGMFGVVCWQVR